MISFLDDTLWFPQVETADEDGLLAAGGDLSTDRLLLAYRNGIFPWFNEDEIPLWWCPDPRFVLFPQELHISQSMNKAFKKHVFDFSVNTAFEQVIHHCRFINRDGQDGTWITPEVEQAYIQLHRLGYAHSAEAWCNGVLAGGVYGIRLGNTFFGESMFSLQANASKFAFIKWVQLLQQQGVTLIDCQVYTDHLKSLGARYISRTDFLKLIV